MKEAKSIEKVIEKADEFGRRIKHNTQDEEKHEKKNLFKQTPPERKPIIPCPYRSIEAKSSNTLAKCRWWTTTENEVEDHLQNYHNTSFTKALEEIKEHAKNKETSGKRIIGEIKGHTKGQGSGAENEAPPQWDYSSGSRLDDINLLSGLQEMICQLLHVIIIGRSTCL